MDNKITLGKDRTYYVFKKIRIKTKYLLIAMWKEETGLKIWNSF
jgi:hypothetical protein